MHKMKDKNKLTKPITQEWFSSSLIKIFDIYVLISFIIIVYKTKVLLPIKCRVVSTCSI